MCPSVGGNKGLYVDEIYDKAQMGKVDLEITVNVIFPFPDV